MSKPTKARTVTARCTLIAGAVLLGACSGDLTGPAAAPTRSIEANSMFVPSASAKALYGMVDGTYTYTFDPSKDQSIALGANRLDVPANSVCNLLTSGYGMATWNRACAPETKTVTLTVVVKHASSNNPSMDFFPAMRFNPTKNVQLFMYAPKVNKKDAKDWRMFYCPDKGKCIDESLTDDSLETSIDRSASVLFRRVKHFSGYTVAERAEDASSTVGGLLP